MSEPDEFVASLREDRDRWRRLARHLCYKAGHGPHPLAGSDGKKCGTCEGNTAKFLSPTSPIERAIQ